MVGYRLERKTEQGWKPINALLGRRTSWLGIDEPMYSRWGPTSGFCRSDRYLPG